MTGPAVIFNDVSKSYGDQTILTAINLQVIQGEYLGLVGVNGAGKTTLIKCLLDFTFIMQGSIMIYGEHHRNTAARKHIAFLPEKFVPPYYLTGKDFLAYMSQLYDVRSDIENIEQVFAILDLDPAILEKPVRQLSKGMSQKLGLAACLLSKKELLILDEPMSGLDPRARAYLKKYLLELKHTGKTLFFSTHMLSDIETLCDKVAILHNGSLMFTGTPEECCIHFATDNFEQAYLNCVNA